MSVSNICGLSIFEVLEQRAESVISVIKYIIEKANTSPNAQNGAQDAPARLSDKGTYYDRNGVLHKRVDMKNATGGWY